MSIGQSDRSRKKLPRHYWPIMFVAVLVVMFLTAVIAATVGLNPHIVMLISGGAFVLREVWKLTRAGF